MAIRHFGAKHFNGLYHFVAIHFGGARVEIVVPPSGGGGGPYPVVSRGPGYYTLDPRFLKKSTRYVIVNVDFKNGKSWKKHYVVDVDKADLIIKIINWTNRLKTQISIGVESIRKVGGKISALFTRNDK